MAQKNLQNWGSSSWYKDSSVLAANKFVKQTAATTIGLVTAATDIVIGAIIDTTIKTDVPITVYHMGIVPVEVGSGGVVLGTYVKTDASGCIVTSSLANADKVVGIALETVAEGSLCSVLLLIQGMPAA